MAGRNVTVQFSKEDKEVKDDYKVVVPEQMEEFLTYVMSKTEDKYKIALKSKVTKILKESLSKEEYSLVHTIQIRKPQVIIDMKKSILDTINSQISVIESERVRERLEKETRQRMEKIPDLLVYLKPDLLFDINKKPVHVNDFIMSVSVYLSAKGAITDKQHRAVVASLNNLNVDDTK